MQQLVQYFWAMSWPYSHKQNFLSMACGQWQQWYLWQQLQRQAWGPGQAGTLSSIGL